MTTITKVKTKSGSEFYVKEDDFYILLKSENDLFIHLTLLTFNTFIDESCFEKTDWKSIKKQSSEFFHRDDIVWFKTYYIK